MANHGVKAKLESEHWREQAGSVWGGGREEHLTRL